MTMLSRRTLLLATMAAAAPLPAFAQAYPARPIKMIAPFTPGSPVDVVARLLAQHLSIQLGQSVVVENRPGAGTTIGMKAAMLAEPDGYTLLFQSSSLVVAPAMYKNLDYDPVKSFAPVANVAFGSWVTIVPPSLPVKSAQELMAYARANPGKLNFGFGQGTAPQLVGEWFNRSNGLEIAGVPYKGGMQAVTDMLGGTIHINIGVTATLLPLIREGKVRAIAVWSKARHPELPEVPTMIESGFPGLSLGFWVGLWAPAGTPAAVIDKVNAAANVALRSPEMMASMKRLGVDGSPGSPQDFATFIADEAPKWADIVKASGVKVE
jgi:tripartite-type tricarboxylate transporter receptor subunit TctC